ncbi:MAG: hypothetical protein KGZ58_05615 [Ignavibacteriales bacterium]|nr:hypothetical protein [Ignavibacteriales bacterium]
MKILTADDTDTARIGADFILIGGLTLFGDGQADNKTLYFQFLKKHYPQLVSRYEKIYNSYSPSWQYENDLRVRAKRIYVKHKIRNSIL